MQNLSYDQRVQRKWGGRLGAWRTRIGRNPTLDELALLILEHQQHIRQWWDDWSDGGRRQRWTPNDGNLSVEYGDGGVVVQQRPMLSRLSAYVLGER